MSAFHRSWRRLAPALALVGVGATLAPSSLAGGASVPAAGSLRSSGTSGVSSADPATDGGARRATAGAVAAPVSVDPGRRGPYRTVEGQYSARAFRHEGLRAPIETLGVVVAPVGARGPRPLVVFLHGQHAPCFRGGPKGDVINVWPCPAGYRPVPSHRGYLQTQRLLASQGYVTVSVAANGVNAQDLDVADGGAEARAAVLQRHLRLWATWAGAGRGTAPAIVLRSPRPDLARVLLVGHSRGGDGVNRAAVDSAFPTGDRPPWRVVGTVYLAPIAYGMNPAPGVQTAVLLPSCDGDTADLQGQLYVDGVRDVTADPALRSAVFVVGANHNWFNSEWTPGSAVAPARDDWGDRSDPACGSRAGRQRLTPAQQRAVAATYVATAARVFVARDAKALPLLDGSGARAASAGSARVLTHALGGRRTPLVVPGRTGTGRAAPVLSVTGAGTTATVCTGLVYGDGYRRTCLARHPAANHPHFAVRRSILDGEPVPRAVSVVWTRAGGAARIRLPAAVSIAGSTSVALRVAVPAGSRGTRVAVRLTDADGRTATIGTVALDGTPRTRRGGSSWAQEARLPLTGVRGVDLRRVVAMTLAPRTATGRLLLLDAWGYRPGLSSARPPAIPRLDVGSVRIVEGDAGTTTAALRLTLTAPPARAGAVYVVLDDSRTSTFPPGDSGRVVPVPPGARHVDIPVTVTGNTVDDGDGYVVRVLVVGLENVVVGRWSGDAVVVDDDPPPE